VTHLRNLDEGHSFIAAYLRYSLLTLASLVGSVQFLVAGGTSTPMRSVLRMLRNIVRGEVKWMVSLNNG
jgi:hypothetical protein